MKNIFRLPFGKSPSGKSRMRTIVTALCTIFAVLAAFALLFSAYGGRVAPLVWKLPAMATLVLPVVAVAALVLLAVLAGFKQWPAALVLVGAFCLSWPTLRLIAPCNIVSVEADTCKTHLKVLTMNVTQFNWADNDTCPSANMRYILDQDADIVVIQEGLVYFSYEHLATVKPMLEELYEKYPYRKKHFFDVGILSKYPFNEVPSPMPNDSLNYYIKAWDVDAPGGNLRVVGMHLSSLSLTDNDRDIIDKMNTHSDRKGRIRSVKNKLGAAFVAHAQEAAAMREFIDNTAGDLLIMGDMNDTPGSFTYRTICGDDVRDAWADVGFGPMYTYHDHHLYVKIDHILYRGGLKPLACRSDRAGESDHYPMVATFER